MMVGKEDLALTLGIGLQRFFPNSEPRPHWFELAYGDHGGGSEGGGTAMAVAGERGLKGIDVDRAPAVSERESEEEAGTLSSPNSTVSSILSGKRDIHPESDEDEDEDGDGDGDRSRKKLRLSKDQSAVLEESFKEHNILNPKQKVALAKQLNLRPRQVEVWFQNRRARTKLKQTEVDCEFLKRCCENLTEENRRLHKEVQELRALKLSPQMFMHMTPPTTLTMCPSCERISSAPTATAPPAHHHHRRPIAGVASFLDARPQRS